MLTGATPPPPAGFDTLLERAARSERRPFVFLPSIPWNEVLFQRPQHIARELGRLGHPVVNDCTGTRQELDKVREIEPNVFLYNGPPRHLTALRDAVVWALSYNYHLVRGGVAGGAGGGAVGRVPVPAAGDRVCELVCGPGRADRGRPEPRGTGRAGIAPGPPRGVMPARE